MKSIKTEILVVGSGPAGSATAISIAKAGGEVTILDRKNNIGIPVQCGEAIGKSGAKTADLEIPKESIRAPIRGFRIYSPGGYFIDYARSEPDGVVVDRRVFDKELFARAVEHGADTLLGVNVTDTIVEKRKVVGVVGQQSGERVEVRAQVIVGADGVNSLIAKKTKLRKFLPLRDLDSCASYEMVDVDIEDNELMEFYFGTKLAPRGYVWIFPKGPRRTNVGIGVGGGTVPHAKILLDKFLQENKLITSKAKNAKIIEFRAGAIPVGGLNKQFVTDNVVLVGDAAGQVHPVTGGGIGYAMVAGKFAGETLAESISQGNTSEDFLMQYEKRYREKYETEFTQSMGIRSIIADETEDSTLDKLAQLLQGEDIIELTRGKKVKIAMKALATGDARIVRLMNRLKDLKVV
jgi:digeranylgeranylglycerophospholipid reductase